MFNLPESIRARPVRVPGMIKASARYAQSNYRANERKRYECRMSEKYKRCTVCGKFEKHKHRHRETFASLYRGDDSFGVFIGRHGKRYDLVVRWLAQDVTEAQALAVMEALQ